MMIMVTKVIIVMMMIMMMHIWNAVSTLETGVYFIQTSPIFVHHGPIVNDPALVKMAAWHQSCDPTMACMIDAKIVTRPQLAKLYHALGY